MIGDSHRISVVIPTLGRVSSAACTAALQRQTRPPDEVIVIEDIERRGAAWARNEGIRRSGGDLIAFIDDDCVPPSTWLAELTQAIDDWDAAGVGGTYDESDPFYAALRARRGFPCETRLDDQGWVGAGGNLMYRRAWLERCRARDGHVFNEQFRISQDWELAWRLRRYGARLVFVGTRVKHLRCARPWAYLRQQFWRGRGIALLFIAQRQANGELLVHKSLLWGQRGRATGARWARAFWHKVVGPFDFSGLTSLAHAALFWLGEKFQGAGFVWQLLLQTGQPLTGSAAGTAPRAADDELEPTRARPARPAAPPAFSVVLETENLANVDPACLFRCLDSLAAQNLSATQANELVMVNSGHAPVDVLDRVRGAYPWVQIVQVPEGTGYYDAKVAGASRTSGEVVVFCDSDCRYEAGWLRAMVEVFRDPEVEVVSGETSIPVTNPYSMAMNLVWNFPVPSGRQGLYRHTNYLANNFAIRQRVLQACPIPQGLPIYRGNCAIHSVMLRERSYTIWKQPAARSSHPTPAPSVRGFFWRWLLHGHDQFLWWRLMEARGIGPRWRFGWQRDLVTVLRQISEVTWKPLRRLPRLLRVKPHAAVMLPVVICILPAALLVALAGAAMAVINSPAVLARGAAALKDGSL
jgi:glycosyltransferase involved in cell wall biosynthesis